MQRLTGFLVLCALAGTIHVLPALGAVARAEAPEEPKGKPPVADTKPKEATPPNPSSSGLLKIIEEYPGWAAGFGLLLLIGVGVLLYHAAKSPAQAPAVPFILTLGPSFFFWLGMVYLALLLLIAAIYSSAFATTLIGGLLPLGVPWFGALGAVIISLEGVFLWNDQWKTKYNYWHLGRPLFGAVLGIVAFFLFFLLVYASGATPGFLQGKENDRDPKNVIVYFVVAFLVGYREETFRELIKRATDLILKPATPAAEAPTVVFEVDGVVPLPHIIEFGPPPAGGQPYRKKVQIHNTGKTPVVTPVVTVSTTSPHGANVFTIDPAIPFAAGVNLLPGETKTIEVILTAPAGVAYSGMLTLNAQNLPAPLNLPLSRKV